MKIQPIGENILVRDVATKESETTASGLVLETNSYTGETMKGEVIAADPGNFNGIKPGQTILFKKNIVGEIEDGNETFLLISSSSILAVITD